MLFSWHTPVKAALTQMMWKQMERHSHVLVALDSGSQGLFGRSSDDSDVEDNVELLWWIFPLDSLQRVQNLRMVIPK